MPTFSRASLRKLLRVGQQLPRHDGFCDACRPGKDPDKEISGAALLESSSGGCAICQFLCDILAAFDCGPISDDHVILLKTSSGRLTYLHGPPGWVEIYGTTELTPAVEWLRIARDIAFDSGIKSCLDVAKNWVQQCDQYHETCLRERPGPLPRRVLDLGVPGSNRLQRLYESRGEREPYIALSHCWGSCQPLTTERATLGARMEGIPDESLPKTFRDAIAVTRELSVRFLWIDSLCIIQDDRNDWEVESANMCTVYENAYLTIAATGAPNGSCGFLGPRVDLSTKTVRFKGSKQSFDVKTRIFKSHYGEEIVDTNPLITRGWFLQEYLISHRTLSYRLEEMSWHCKLAIECECNAEPESQTWNLLSWEDYSKGLSEAATMELTYHYWREVVNQYTRMDLSKESDRLPALSALAAKFQAKTKDIYLGGLWKNDLVVGFTWTTLPGLSELPQEHRAPSWCWSSIGGPVDYSTYERAQWKCFIEILEVQCTSAGANPFGDIREGFVKLHGQIVTAIVKIPPSYNVDKMTCTIWPESHPECATYGFSPDVPLDVGTAMIVAGKCEGTLLRARNWICNPNYDTQVRVHCLLVAKNTNYHFVLVLGRSQTVMGAYERLGILRLHGEDEFTARWPQYRQEEATVTIV